TQPVPSTQPAPSTHPTTADSSTTPAAPVWRRLATPSPGADKRATLPAATEPTPPAQTAAGAAPSDAAAATAPTPDSAPHAEGSSSEYEPRPGEPLAATLQRIAPARTFEPETAAVLQAAQEVLQNLPGSVIPADDPALTGQIPIVTARNETGDE
ncbi:MAG: hypothetical protein Q4P06_07495, partial [Actinomycetaceae bacterium]|nr:hypothetical protein [Actinomycetaceae bacterium]